MNGYQLTPEDVLWLDSAQRRLAEAETHAKPKVDPEGVSVNPTLIPSLLTRARLSKATTVAEERRLAKMHRKRKVLRTRKKRARGRYHWASKAKTKRRQKAARWEDNPMGCLLKGYGYKQLDPALWERHIAPLWKKYSPSDLKVVWPSWAGTKGRPKTIYNMQVVHATGGVVYDGDSQLLYDLSSGAGLDNSCEA